MLTVAEIQRRVAARYSLSVGDFISHKRSPEVIQPRQVAMYLARKVTHKSLTQIGRRFERHHSTVIEAIRTVEGLRANDREIDREIALIALDALAPTAEAPEETNPYWAAYPQFADRSFAFLAGTMIRRDALPAFPGSGAI